MTRALRLLPILLVVLIVGLLLWRIARPGEEAIPSQMVGKPVPQFALPAAAPGKPALASTDLAAGKPQLLNVFASWCVPCIAEAQVLDELHRRGVPIVAVAVRDRPEDVAAFLARHGDPFARIGADDSSRVMLALGSSGVPESFVVDGRGIIRHQHIGPIEPEDIPTILAEMEKAR